MIKNRDRVCQELRDKVLLGFDPDRSLESAEDHWTDWTVLSQEEFDEIKRAARQGHRTVDANAD